MRVLVADDMNTSRLLLKSLLEGWGYQVELAQDGLEAIDILNGFNPPKLAIIDWLMPKVDGVELCKKVRKNTTGSYIYIVLLTSKVSTQDVVTGLEAGADDYIIKPFSHPELRSRIMAGERIIRLETTLAMKVAELEESKKNIQELHALLPMCLHCRRIRDEKKIWRLAEEYIERHLDVEVSHVLCESCEFKYNMGKLKINQEEK